MSKPNRLVHEKSPYLLQHAHNPVDWYPWGDEAFEKAKREDKPVFLSVGYSTCHWCHVMERESFENAGIAAILNEGFVCIKVDREERPDVDHVYMTFVQATTGAGGWPMSVWLTPDAKPFYGGTYFPPFGRGGRPGFAEVLQTIRGRWTSHREQIVQSSHEILELLQARAHPQSSAAIALEPALLDSAYRMQQGRFDAAHGGFGGAPKFPRPYELLFLHRVHARSGDPEALAMSVATLRAMAEGGIHDQLGGGFHRYSTDATWRLPHFEKMLYDQAQLVMAYVEAYQLSGEERFAVVARDILAYVQRDLTGDHGGFLSAEDADSAADPGHPEEKLEGAFYVWTRAALDALLGADAELVARHYGVLAGGNVGGGELAGQNVLYVAEPLPRVAAALGVEPQDAVERLRAAQVKLLTARAKRPRPHRDDKVITAWNGLMLSAAARAASVLDAPEHLAAAVRAADFLHVQLWDAEKHILLRRFRDGEAAVGGFNADYAFLVQGLLDLYEACFDLRWLDWAEELTERQIELFGDPAGDGFFEDSGADARLLLRSKEDYDGAEPASNSVSVLNLLRLGEMLDSDRYRERARNTLGHYAGALQRAGAALPAMLLALDFQIASPSQIIVAGRPGAADTAALLATVYRRFLPHKVLLLADGGSGQEHLAASLPLLGSIGMESGKATAYVCQNYTCKLPVTTTKELARLLDPGK